MSDKIAPSAALSLQTSFEGCDRVLENPGTQNGYRSAQKILTDAFHTQFGEACADILDQYYWKMIDVPDRSVGVHFSQNDQEKITEMVFEPDKDGSAHVANQLYPALCVFTRDLVGNPKGSGLSTGGEGYFCYVEGRMENLHAGLSALASAKLPNEQNIRARLNVMAHIMGRLENDSGHFLPAHRLH